MEKCRHLYMCLHLIEIGSELSNLISQPELLVNYWEQYALICDFQKDQTFLYVTFYSVLGPFRQPIFHLKTDPSQVWAPQFKLPFRCGSINSYQIGRLQANAY